MDCTWLAHVDSTARACSFTSVQRERILASLREATYLMLLIPTCRLLATSQTTTWAYKPVDDQLSKEAIAITITIIICLAVTPRTHARLL